jgi:hypothetical protein
MTLEELIDRLRRFGDVELGHGPRHPAAPDPALAPEIDAFLDRYPVLRRDPGYVAFLERYSGLYLSRDEDALALSIFGFDTDVALHIVEGEGDLLIADFLPFAHAVVPLRAGSFNPHDPGVAYAFDIGGSLPAGVYRNVKDHEFELCAPSFLDWLEQLDRLEGNWL